MLIKWLESRKRKKEEEYYECGYAFAAAKLLRGAGEDEMDSYMYCSFDEGQFECGVRRAVFDWQDKFGELSAGGVVANA